MDKQQFSFDDMSAVGGGIASSPRQALDQFCSSYGSNVCSCGLDFRPSDVKLESGEYFLKCDCGRKIRLAYQG